VNQLFLPLLIGDNLKNGNTTKQVQFMMLNVLAMATQKNDSRILMYGGNKSAEKIT